MKVFLSDQHRLHFPDGELSGGKLVRTFECPERWDFIVEALGARGYADFAEPGELDFGLVAKVHAPDFLDFLESAHGQWCSFGYDGDALPLVVPARRMKQQPPRCIEGLLGYYCMALDTAITAGTWQAARSSSACAVDAQRHVNVAGAAFALCRPPGHHAARDLYGGYCFLNNAAIAAEGFLADGAARVAVLDVDFHHGNGTQDIFYARDDVIYLSLHGRPEDAFPHFLGFADETGQGRGEGFNVNFPLPPGTGYDAWGAALDDACRRIAAYAPDALVVSLGVDTFEKDPISFFKLTGEDFSRLGARIGALRLPTLFVMEGGYAVAEIGVNTANVLDAFQGA